MKSRITIEVDFDNNNLPVIQVLSQDSDDVRDKLIKSFLQSLQHTSRWCKILYKDYMAGTDIPTTERWQIVPIIPSELNKEMNLMQGVINRKAEPAE